MAESFEEYLAKKAGTIDAHMHKYLAERSSEQFMEALLGKPNYKYNNDAMDKAILEPAWYLFGLGGKRWRPILMLLVIEALGKSPEAFADFSILPEIVHNATLIHDDIEDNSQTRRGSPAVHVKYGIDVAVNLGDFLYYFPIVMLMKSKKLESGTKLRLFDIYVNEMLRVCSGQATDIAWHNFSVKSTAISEEEYMQMVYNKTGVLARMACKMAAVLAGADDATAERLGHFGATIGVAFQIQDDLLNIMPSALAKNKGGIGDDISEGKITLMVVYTLKRASAKEGERLLEILSMHTKSKKLIGEAIGIMKRHGADGYARDCAKRIMMDAWSGTEKSLKESDAKRKLKGLVEFLVSRSI